jgi:ABC-type branched-subunit amino acid transport system ATPase component
VTLDVRALQRSFGGIRALDGCTFAVQDGSITGLIGPNGSGKTTLINVVTGFVAAQAGEVRFRERVLGRTPEAVVAAGIARTFQHPRVFPRLTVAENMQVPVRRRGLRGLLRSWAADDERARAEELLGLVGLAELRSHRAGELSHGQRKLLELAMALRSEPRMILLDEPAAGVNPWLVEALAERVRELRAGGVTFLIVEHDMEFVMSLCDHVVVMHQGRAIASGPPQLVASDPDVLEAYLGGADDDG